MSAFQEQPLPISVATVADLATSRARTANGGVVTTTGHLAVGDNGGASYIYYRTGRSGVTIDGNVFIAGPGTEDYWKLATLDECRSSQFGAVGDGTTDDRAALLAADAAATAAASVSVTLTPGVYAVASHMTLSNPIKVLDGARLKPANGVVVTISSGFVAGASQYIFDISAGGSFVIQKASSVSARNFGADPTGVADSTDELNALFAVASANNCGRVICDGTYLISGQLTVGPSSILAADGQNRTKNYQGSMTINCSGTFTTALLIRNSFHIMWEGQIRIYGTGGVGYETRTITNGVILSGLNHSQLTGFYLLYFLGDAVVIDGTVFTYDNTITDIFVFDAGSSGITASALPNLAGTWGTRVDSGTSGGFDQYSRITVTELPPTSCDSIPKTINIDGKLHHVLAIDRNSSTVDVYPWITPVADTSGSYMWTYGSGLRITGSESAGNTITHMSILRAGNGLSVESLYGPNIGILQTQAVGVGLSVGKGTSDLTSGTNIDRYYGETLNEFHILSKTSASKAINVDVFVPAEIEKIVSCTSPVVSAWDIPSPVYHTLNGFTLGLENGPCTPNKPLNNSEVSSGAAFLDITTPRDVGYFSNSFTVILLLPESASIERLGMDTFSFTMYGSGSNRQPTGTITITPPSGWKINSGTVDANATFSSFNAPTTFHGYLDLATNNILISFTPPSIPENTALKRVNHQGVQPAATISDFATSVAEITSPTSYGTLLSTASSILNGDANLDGTGDADDLQGAFNGTWGGTAVYDVPPVYKGKAFVLDGTKHISQASAAGNFTNNFTVACWVKVRAISYFSRIVSKTAPGSPAWEIYLTAARALVFSDGNTGGTSADGLIQVGQWHHVAAVINGASSRLYIDGAAVGSTFGVLIGTNSHTVDWGRLDPAIDASTLDGSLYQCSIYNAVLSASDVALLHDRSLADVEPLGDAGSLGTGTLTYSFGPNKGSYITGRATGSIALAFTATLPGHYTAIIEIDTGTPPSITYSTSVVGTAPAIDTADNAKTLIPLFFDGATWFHV